MNVKVSVIVPVYNVESYIEESLKSICLQNFDSFEIIVVNDGTKDKSVDIAESVLANYKIPYVIINRDNGGLPVARNEGLRIARGEYVCFVDSDDIISSTHISDLWECCNRHGLVASYALFQLTNENNRWGCPTKDNFPRVIRRKKVLHDFLIRKIRVHCCALLIRRDYLLNNNILFNEKLRYGEDIDFMWRLFPTIASLGCTENESYMYLQRSNSLMTMQNIDRVIVLLDEFKKTVDSLMMLYPEDIDTLQYLFGKASLAFYRTFAETSEYDVFVDLLKRTNYRRAIRGMIGIDSIRLNLLGICLLISPTIFIKLVTSKRETVRRR